MNIKPICKLSKINDENLQSRIFVWIQFTNLRPQWIHFKQCSQVYSKQSNLYAQPKNLNHQGIDNVRL